MIVGAENVGINMEPEANQNQTDDDSDFDDDNFSSSSSSRSSLLSNAPSVEHFNISVSCLIILCSCMQYLLPLPTPNSQPSLISLNTVHIQEDISWTRRSQGISLDAFYTQSCLHVLTEVDIQHLTLHYWNHGCLSLGSDQRSHCLPPSLDPLSSD